MGAFAPGGERPGVYGSAWAHWVRPNGPGCWTWTHPGTHRGCTSTETLALSLQPLEHELSVLRDHLPPIDAYLADAASLDEEGFLERYPWPWLVVPEPSADILSRIRRPETVIAQSQTQAIEMPGPHLRGASLDALCLEARPVQDRDAESARIRLGRSQDADVVLLDESVSRFHAELEVDRREGRSAVLDLDSKNGTFLDQRKLPPFESTVLDGGEVLRLGAIFARLHSARSFYAWLVEGAPRSGAAPGIWPE